MSYSIIGNAIGSVAQASGFARDSRLSREQSRAAEERRKKQEEDRAEKNAYNISLRTRDEAIVKQNQDNATAAEERLVAAENRAAELNTYNIGQRPNVERRAEDQNNRLEDQNNRAEAEAGVLADKAANEAIANFNQNHAMARIAASPHYGMGTPLEFENPIEFARENPGVTGDILSRHKAFQFAMVNGERVEVDVVGVDITDTSVTPRLVIAETGEAVPATVGGTNASDDGLLAGTHAQFSKMMNNELISIISNGGSESQIYQNELLIYGGLTADDVATAKAQVIRDEAIKLGRRAGIKDPELARQFLLQLQGETDPNEMARIYEEMGGDLEQLAAKIDPKNARSPLSRMINPRGDRGVGPATETLMTNLGLTRPGELDIYQDIQRKIGDVSSAGGKTGLLKSQSKDDYDNATAAENWYDKNSGKLAKQMFANKGIQAKFDSLGAAEFYKTFGTDTDGNPVDPSKIGEAITPPPFNLGADTLLKAIADQATQPTAEQREQMFSYLQSKEINTDASFTAALDEKALPKREAVEAIWVAAAYSSGTPSEKLKRAQQLLNLATNGDINYGKKDREATDERAEMQKANIAAKTATAQALFVENDVARVTTQANTFTDTFMKITTDAKGEKVPPSQELNQKIAQSLHKPMIALNNAKTKQGRQTMLASMNPALSYLLQGEAAKRPGFFGWLGEVLTPGTREVDGGQISDINLQYVREGDDGTLVYAPPGGAAGEVVELTDLDELGGNVRKLLELAAAVNSEE